MDHRFSFLSPQIVLVNPWVKPENLNNNVILSPLSSLSLHVVEKQTKHGREQYREQHKKFFRSLAHERARGRKRNGRDEQGLEFYCARGSMCMTVENGNHVQWKSSSRKRERGKRTHKGGDGETYRSLCTMVENSIK